MTKQELTHAVLTAKSNKKCTWAAIAQAAGLSEVYVTSACLGENALEEAEAKKVAALLDLSDEAVAAFGSWANKGEASPTIPKEPLQYRLQEIIYVYGPTIKALVEEKIRRGHHERHRFHDGYRQDPRPERRPGENHDERQIPYLQEMVA